MAADLGASLGPETRKAVEHIGPLQPVAGAVTAVRRRVSALFAAWNMPPDIADDALLVVCELLTNAVVHALPPVELRLSYRRCDGLGTLCIEVTDAGPGPTAGQWPEDSDPDEHGRGKGIVHALAARHGIRIRRGRVSRWAELVWG